MYSLQSSGTSGGKFQVTEIVCHKWHIAGALYNTGTGANAVM